MNDAISNFSGENMDILVNFIVFSSFLTIKRYTRPEVSPTIMAKTIPAEISEIKKTQ